MSTFQIHQDVKNQKILLEKDKPMKEKSKIPVKQKLGEKNDLAKKTFFCNWTVLKPEENNQEAEQNQVKNEKQAIPVEPFLQIQIENNPPECKKEKQKEMFPFNLLHNLDYRHEIFPYLKTLEQSFLPRPTYMEKQTELNWNSRSILVDWLASVSEEYNYCDDTFHLAINYIDRFLSHICVARKKFQLVGATAMMLSSKMEEYYPFDASEWAYLTKNTFSSKEVLKMEQVILKVLKFRMQPPTVNVFIDHLVTEHKMDEKTVNLAKYIADLVLLEGDGYLEIFPSKIASACIALARYILWKRNTWPKKLMQISGYSLKDLSPVVQRQNKTLKLSPLKPQQAIQSKYKNKKFNSVALLKPRRLIMEDWVKE